MCMVSVLAGALLCSLHAARAAAVDIVAEVRLPDAPGRTGSEAAEIQEKTASVSGTVLDINGAVVPHAEVTLTSGERHIDLVVEADAAGAFHFAGLPSGVFRVTVTAKGLETFLSNEIKLSAGERYHLPRIDLPIAPENTSVTVVVTEDELATEQVHEQEKQRVLGVLPNFYTSFLWNAAPMRSKQKFRLMLRSVTDPVVFVSVGIRAGVEQARGTYPGYGDGLQGFAERYGAAYGDSVTGRIVGSALLPALLHQDPRYFYKGTGSKTSRAWYAVRQAVVCRGDNGRTQPNYSHVLGNFAAAGLRNVYLAPEDRKSADTILNGFTITGFNAVSNLVREFLFRRATTNVPDYKNGQPAVD